MTKMKNVATSDEAKKLAMKCAIMADNYNALALELKKNEEMNSLFNSDLFKRASALVDSYEEEFTNAKETKIAENEAIVNKALQEFETVHLPKLQKVLALGNKVLEANSCHRPFNKIFGLRFINNTHSYPYKIFEFNGKEEYVDVSIVPNSDFTQKSIYFEIEALYVSGNSLEKGFSFIVDKDSCSFKRKIEIFDHVRNRPKAWIGLWLQTLNPYWDEAIDYFLEQLLDLDAKKDGVEAANRK